MWAFDKPSLEDDVLEAIYPLIQMRTQLPDMGNQRWDWTQLAYKLVSSRSQGLFTMVLDLIEANHLMVVVMENLNDDEAGLLTACARTNPSDTWADLMHRLEENQWRVGMQIRGWLVNAFPAELVSEWVGESRERARRVAAIANAGGERPTDIARFLLGEFGKDDEVKANLMGDFMSGSWVGPESARIRGQISQLTAWRTDEAEPLGVRNWSKQMIEHLEQRLRAAVELEEERGF
jgi:hypothetical protein